MIVPRWDRDAPRPRDALVFVDQEGGDVRAFPQLPPAAPASAYTSRRGRSRRVARPGERCAARACTSISRRSPISRRARSAPVRWARRAALAGADLLLFTSPEHARRAIRALVPLARKGLLDEHVRRVLRLRRSLRLADESGW